MFWKWTCLWIVSACQWVSIQNPAWISCRIQTLRIRGGSGRMTWNEISEISHDFGMTKAAPLRGRAFEKVIKKHLELQQRGWFWTQILNVCTHNHKWWFVGFIGIATPTYNITIFAPCGPVLTIQSGLEALNLGLSHLYAMHVVSERPPRSLGKRIWLLSFTDIPYCLLICKTTENRSEGEDSLKEFQRFLAQKVGNNNNNNNNIRRVSQLLILRNDTVK